MEFSQIFEKANSIYDASDVERWHTQPKIPGQTTGDHSFKMLVLLLKLHPDPSKDLMRAIIEHDLGERDGIDFPGNLKTEFPILKTLDNIFAERFADKHGFRKITLCESDELWLSFLDRFESLLYVTTNVHNISGEPKLVVERLTKSCSVLFDELKERGFFQ